MSAIVTGGASSIGAAAARQLAARRAKVVVPTCKTTRARRSPTRSVERSPMSM
ncbi:MAG: hypothetical protein R2705_11715 [Ilumatobacteraceae bacterium]